MNEILAKIEAGDNERPATFGQRMYRVAFMSGIFWARQGTFKKSTLNWMWKLNNIRNKHIHTGRALTKADREFLATVPERIDALLNKLAA